MNNPSESLANDELILEGIVTTRAETGAVNVSPMGPRVDRAITQLVLRPFQTSRTYQNLKRTGAGVFHVTDDVELIARCAIGRPEVETCECDRPPFVRLRDCCRWFAFEVVELDERDARTTIRCRIVDSGSVRDFFGFNRAKHAVVEASILATRTHLLEPVFLQHEFARLKTLIEKTAGIQERRSFEILSKYVAGQIAVKE